MVIPQPVSLSAQEADSPRFSNAFRCERGPRNKGCNYKLTNIAPQQFGVTSALDMQALQGGD